jgi:ABC-type transport system involved in multi-copper enzyme maturation permease subunit
VTAIAPVALNAFRESVRDRVLYVLVLFAILLIGTSVLIGQLTAGQDIKIIKDLGLAAISLIGLLVAVFIGVGLVWKEVERRSIYSVLPKPIRRVEFILGKYCGLAGTLLVVVAVMTATYYLVLGVLGSTFPDTARAAWPAPATDPGLLTAILLIFVELMLVTAIALFFSTFSSPFLSMVLTVAVWVIGTLSADLRNADAFLDSGLAIIFLRGLYYVLPNFAAFDVKLQVVHGLDVPWTYVVTTALYGVLYTAFVLTGAALIFQRREFR